MVVDPTKYNINVTNGEHVPDIVIVHDDVFGSPMENQVFGKLPAPLVVTRERSSPCLPITSPRIVLIHTASRINWLRALYSASVDDKAVVVYILLPHATSPKPR